MSLSPEDTHSSGLHWLLRNLKAVDDQLISIASEQVLNNRWLNTDTHLSQEGLSGWQDIRMRIARHLTPKSPLFRHAVRISVVLCVGYTFIILTGLERGYWILLTCLFVCQPNYSATRKRLTLRIMGTLGGVIIGLPLLWLVPSVAGQLALIVLTGVLFFAFRQVRYAQATVFITLVALLSFNLLGQGFDVALPRIVDTLLGCALSWMAVAWIFPDWRYRQLPAVTDRAFSANAKYLAAITRQYHAGKDNSMSYRIARRDAHNADADLALMISGINDPGGPQLPKKDVAFRISCLNHSFLSYLSALGAHRDKITRPDFLQLMDDVLRVTEETLVEHSTEVSQQLMALRPMLDEFNGRETTPGSHESVILQQINLLLSLLPELRAIRQESESH